MQKFQSDGAEIAFSMEGCGDPILLIHGFASNAMVNWMEPGWGRALAGAGFAAIALDNRGHGRSEKLHDPQAYRLSLMAGDALALLDHLGVGRADIFGYSMGAWIAARLAVDHPQRVRSLVLGGVGTNLLSGFRQREAIAASLLAPDPDAVGEERDRAYRRFAKRTGSDLEALAACVMAPSEGISAKELNSIVAPVLIACGANDPQAATAAELSGLFGRAELLLIPGRDHMNVVGDSRLRQAVIDFLARRP